MADKESTIKTIFALDGETKYKDAIKDINREQSSLRAEMGKVDAAYKINGDRVQYNKDKVEVLNKQVDLQKRRVDETRNAMEQATAVYGENSAQAQRYKTELTRAETSLMKMEEELRKTTEELKKQESAMYQAGQSAIETGEKWQAAGEKMTKTGTALTKGVTAPLLAIAAASTMAWKEVDDSLDDIVKATGATGQELENLHQVWENVVSTMPVDMKAASDAVGELNTQFGTFGEELEGQTRKTVQFAEITGQDVVGAVQGAKKAIELFGAETEDYGRVLDIVAKAGQDTGVSVDKIWNAVQKGAPSLKSLGLGLEESVLLLTQMEQSGLESSRAIGYLGRAQATLAKDGKSLTDGMREFNDVIESGESEVDQLAAASELFGTRGAVFMLEAAQQGKLDFGALADAAGGAAGTVERTFEETLDPIDGFKTAMNNAKLAGAELSDAIQTAAAPMIESLVGVLQGAVTKFKELPPETQEFIVKIGALLAAIGPLLVVGGKLTSWVGNLTTGWGNLLTKMAGSEGILAGVIEKMGGMGPLALAGAAAAAATAIGLTIAKMYEIDPAVKEARKAVDDFAESSNAAMAEVVGQTEMIDQYKTELFELVDAEDKSATQKARIEDLVKRLNTLMPGLNLEYKKETDQLNLTKDAINNVVEAQKLRLIEAAKGKVITEWEETYGDILTNVWKKQHDLNIITEQAEKLEGALATARATGLSDYDIRMAQSTKAVQDHNNWHKELTEEQVRAIGAVNDAYEEGKEAVELYTTQSTDGWSTATHAVEQMSGQSQKLTDDLGELNGELDRGQAIYGTQVDGIDKFMSGLVGLEEAVDDTAGTVVDSYDDMAESAEDAAKRQQEAQEALEKATEQHKNAMSGFTKERFDYEKGTTKQFMDMWEAELTAFRNYHSNLTTIAAKVGPDVAAELEKLGPQAAGLIQQFVDGTDADLARLADLVGERTGAAVTQAETELGLLGGVGSTAGKAFIDGLIKGMKDNQSRARSAAGNVGSAIEGGLKSRLEISSPSKVGTALGQNFAESLGLGITKGEDKAEKDAKDLAQAIMDSTVLTPPLAPLGDLSSRAFGPGDTGTASSVTNNSDHSMAIHVTVPAGESEDFGRRVGRAVADELRKAGFARGQ